MGDEPGQGLVQGVERAVTRRVLQYLTGTGDAGGDAAEGVLAGDLGGPGSGAAGELGPVDEVQDRLAAEPARDPGRQAPLRHGLLGHHVEAGPDRRRTGQRTLEGLRHVVGVHVMQDAKPVIGQGERPAGSQVSPGGRVEVPGRGDDRPARPADVTGVQHHGRDAARPGLLVQQRLDLDLARAVLAVPGAGLVLGHRHPQRRAVDPDGPAVHQQRARRAQRVDELLRRRRGEADQVDHHLRAQRRDPVAERSRRVLRVPVGGDRGHRIPLRAGAIRAAGTAADRDDLVAAVHQPGHEIRADVPRGPDDNYPAHPTDPFRLQAAPTPSSHGRVSPAGEASLAGA